jgi:hypothetical protein
VALAPVSASVKGGLAAALVALAVGAITLNHALVGVFYDDGLYAGLATALAHGQYVHPHLPGTPAAVHYPPLYPALLAPLFGLLSVNAAVFVAKLLNVLLAALATGMIAWHWMRTELIDPATPRWLAPALAAAAAIAIPMLATNSVLFAEPLFALLLAAAVIFADRGASPWWIGVATALALLTRSIGIAAAAGIVCFLASRRRPFVEIARMAVPVALAALCWGAWVLTHENGIDPALAVNYGSYGAILRLTGLSAVGVSAPDLPRPLEVLTLGWIPSRWVFHLLATAALGVGLYGLALLSRRSAIGFTLMFYLAILAIWPYPPDRFLWAVLPWLALAWVIGAIAIWRRWMRLRIPLALLIALLTAGYLRYQARGFAGRWWATQARAISSNFTELLPVIDNLPANSVVATDDEALVWLYTRRQAVPFYLETYRGREVIQPTPAEHHAYLQRMKVSHVLLASASSPSAAELRKLLTDYPGWLTAVYRWPDGRWLFEVKPGS